jgi:hypothetical protein
VPHSPLCRALSSLLSSHLTSSYFFHFLSCHLNLLPLLLPSLLPQKSILYSYRCRCRCCCPLLPLALLSGFDFAVQSCVFSLCPSTAGVLEFAGESDNLRISFGPSKSIERIRLHSISVCAPIPSLLPASISKQPRGSLARLQELLGSCRKRQQVNVGEGQ